jgi:hypothetical protein
VPYDALKIGTLASAAASGIATAAQWLWNLSMWASPITWVVAGIVALVAAIVWVATQTDFFQKAWQYTWIAVQIIFYKAKDGIISGFEAVKGWASNVSDYIGSIPGRIGSAFAGLFNIITSPFRAAFNFVSRAWNNTIGQMSWSVPDWVPGIGGGSIHAPMLPSFHTGGVVPGAPGTEVVAKLMAGETVTPAGGTGAGAPVQIVIRSDGGKMGELLLSVLREAIDLRGGNVQIALGGTV